MPSVKFKNGYEIHGWKAGVFAIAFLILLSPVLIVLLLMSICIFLISKIFDDEWLDDEDTH